MTLLTSWKRRKNRQTRERMIPLLVKLPLKARLPLPRMNPLPTLLTRPRMRVPMYLLPMVLSLIPSKRRTFLWKNPLKRLPNSLLILLNSRKNRNSLLWI